jgi:hypothetical protein
MLSISIFRPELSSFGSIKTIKSLDSNVPAWDGYFGFIDYAFNKKTTRLSPAAM